MNDNQIRERELEFYTLLNPNFGLDVGDGMEKCPEKPKEQV